MNSYIHFKFNSGKDSTPQYVIAISIMKQIYIIPQSVSGRLKYPCETGS